MSYKPKVSPSVLENDFSSRTKLEINFSLPPLLSHLPSLRFFMATKSHIGLCPPEPHSLQEAPQYRMAQLEPLTTLFYHVFSPRRSNAFISLPEVNRDNASMAHLVFSVINTA